MSKHSIIEPHIVVAIATAYGLSTLSIKKSLGGLSAINILAESEVGLLVVKRHSSVQPKNIKLIQSVNELMGLNHIPVALPLKTIGGKRHFVYDDWLYSVYPFREGNILHETTIGDAALSNTGKILAKMHSIQDGNQPKLLTTFDRLKPLNDVVSDAKIIRNLIANNSIDKRTDQLTEILIETKLEVISRIDIQLIARKLPEPSTITHGDFHNENILYDDNGGISCVLDFEEAHKGYGVEDVMTFINFACCNSGFDERSIQKARTFLLSYCQEVSLTKEDLYHGLMILHYRLCSSFFLETELYNKRDTFYYELLKRDLSKLSYIESYSDDIINKLTA